MTKVHSWLTSVAISLRKVTGAMNLVANPRTQPGGPMSKCVVVKRLSTTLEQPMIKIKTNISMKNVTANKHSNE